MRKLEVFSFNKQIFHAVSLSGGKDSTAMLLLMIERSLPINTVLWADTGMEFPEMYDHIRKVDDYLYRERGIHITMLRHPKGFEYLMLFTAKKYLMDIQECEDAVQESLLKLMSRIELLRTLEEPVLTSYVVTTVRNTAINILRRQKRDAQNITSFTESVEESIIEPDSIIDIIMDRGAKRSLREAIDELEANERLLLEGKYFLGYDDRQLSELLSCAPGSIRMKLTRVRRKVLCSMQEKGGA